MSELLRYNVRTGGDNYTATMHTVAGALSRSSRTHAGTDVMAIVEMHLARRFVMTSVYVAKEKVHGRPEGAVTKIVYSKQDMNGSEYGQVLFTGNSAALTWFSPRTPDMRAAVTLDADNSIPEDALFLWARRTAYPYLSRGKPFPVKVLRSLQSETLQVFDAALVLEAQAQVVRVPAGSFTANVFRGAGTTFFVERPEPHRILKWENRAETAELLD